ncbi:MAG: response regulator [Deltaproteobacteria bacterium]|nr:response regulator [Deltaproteobacteria bacterium]
MTADVVPQQLRLLVVEDSDDDFEILLRELTRAGYKANAERVTTSGELAAALARPWDMMITDWLLPGFGGLQALEMLAARDVDLPCIVISGTPNEEAAVLALRAGALDFLSKDRPLRFVPAIERALRESEERGARRSAERELRLSEQRYRTAFEHAPEALLTYDLSRQRVLEANYAAVKLLGRSVDELRASTIGQLSPPRLSNGRDAVEEGRALITRVLAGEELIAHDWEFIAGDGEVIPVELRLARLPSDQAPLLRCTILDQRERLRTEGVRRHAAELELQNRRIQEANRLKSEFLANMSHELRTPLNAIIGFAELLHDGQVDPATPQHKEFLGDILASGRHLLQLINDVLDLAKVEAGKLDFRPEHVELDRLVNEVVSITRTTSAKKGIIVAVERDPSLTSIVIDPARFKQVLYNYLSNALKFTPDAGRVTVRLAAEGDKLFRLEVEDTGVGIAPDDLGRLFVEFQQLEGGASKRHQGTGLGLALTRRLVEAQGGAVGVRSTLGKGSVFHATLPRQARAGEAMLHTPVSTPRLGARTVLVVEDSASDRRTIVDTLAKAGYAVEVATSGADAIHLCRGRSFDAVTLDLLLPDMSGLDCLAALRAEGRARMTPVIVVSVAHDVGLVSAFAVHDVLKKPLDSSSLLTALERAGVRPDRRGGILVVDDDPGALRLMDATLAQLGYSTITRSSGASALEAAQRLHPSAVVLDLVMEGMDGVEFLDQFRQLPQHERTPVLIWTMKDLTEAETERLRAAAQAVVSKNGNSPSTVIEQLSKLLPGGA